MVVKKKEHAEVNKKKKEINKAKKVISWINPDQRKDNINVNQEQNESLVLNED